MRRRFLVMFITMILVLILAYANFGLIACAPGKSNVPADQFYKESQVTLVCPYKAGGGADLDARLFAARWSPNTGGGTMININREAGGGIEGANYVYQAKPDGLTLGHGGPSSSMYVPTLTNDPALKVDITKVNWFGALAPTQFVLAVGNHINANNIDELKQIKGLKFGTFSPSSGFAQAAAIVADVFKLDMKLVTGYTNVTEMNVAIGKKELDAMVIETQAYSLEAKKGFLKPPFFVVDFVMTDWYPDIKPITEIAKLTPDQEKLLTLLTSSSGQGKAFYGPPGMSADKVRFCRDTWNKIMEDKTFLKNAKTLRYPVWVTPWTGEEVAKKAANVMALKESYGVLLDLVNSYVK